MKFEHVLHTYWANYFLYGGRIEPFQTTLKLLFGGVGGFAQPFRACLVKRFELNYFLQSQDRCLSLNPAFINQALNIFLSLTSTVNYALTELYKLSVLRLYLLRTKRGRFHALGKPVRGQRTWSNAWNAYTVNTTLRNYVKQLLKALDKEVKEEKKDYRKITRKYKKTANANAPTSKKEVNKLLLKWF